MLNKEDLLQFTLKVVIVCTATFITFWFLNKTNIFYIMLYPG